MKGEAIVLFDAEETVTPRPGGGFVFEHSETVDPEGFAEAIDAARKRGDAASMAEARKMDGMGQYVMDITTVTRSTLELDASGVVQRGTHTITTTTPRGVKLTETFTLELAQPDAPEPLAALPANPVPAS